ncbi:MAG: Rieske 2Fe-2S domain-containing protein [Verrucomicrobium sp.]|nr:Rieske 2Fe-2S domain-containing protein [Verrucomicrobium sp.]
MSCCSDHGHGEGHGHGCSPQSGEPISVQEMNRRKFLALLSIVPGAIATAAIGVPVAGFVVAPIFAPEKREWVSLGAVSQFKIGDTIQVTYKDPSPLPWAGVTANNGAYVRRTGENDFIAFAVNCSHLGCPVRWIASANLFMCPCHGGVYYSDGSVAAGPPPRALSRYNVRIENGELQLQTQEVPIG